MKVERTPNRSFKPYSIVIRIEEERDEDLLRGLMNKFKANVSPGGIYDGIVSRIQEALSD